MKVYTSSAFLLIALAATASRAQDAPVQDASIRDKPQDSAATSPKEQETAPMQLAFSFVPNASEQARWEIRLGADHTGTFRELGGGAAPQRIEVSEAVWKRLESGTKAVRSGHCETKQRNIAQTGAKTLTVAVKDMPASCTFNYSDDEALNAAAETFLALSEMMREGAKLQQDHRFDRLALDADMEALVTEIAGGRALEPGNIALVLQSIVDDDRVIDRVRRKAARVLQNAGAPPGDKPR